MPQATKTISRYLLLSFLDREARARFIQFRHPVHGESMVMFTLTRLDLALAWIAATKDSLPSKVTRLTDDSFQQVIRVAIQHGVEVGVVNWRSNDDCEVIRLQDLCVSNN